MNVFHVDKLKIELEKRKKKLREQRIKDLLLGNNKYGHAGFIEGVRFIPNTGKAK